MSVTTPSLDADHAPVSADEATDTTTVYRLSNLRATDGTEVVLTRNVAEQNGLLRVTNIEVFLRSLVPLAELAVGFNYQDAVGDYVPMLKLIAERDEASDTWIAKATDGVTTPDPNGYLSVVVASVPEEGMPASSRQLLDPISRSNLFQFSWTW